MSRRRVALWAGFVAVGVLKLLFLDDKGTNDMDTALGWGRTLLDKGLVKGYSGSNFPIAFQIYEGLVWFDRQVGLDGYASMKGLNLLCDLGTFALLRVLLRRWGLNPDWAFAYWISPYFLVMWWLGYDHFQLGLIVVGCVLLIDAERWWLASLVLGVAFLQRPQAQALVLALAAFAALVGLPIWRRERSLRAALTERRVRASLILLVGPAVLWVAYAAWFWTGGRDGGFLLRSYGEVSAFSPALSANMLNVWALVGEAYRHPGEQLSAVHGPGVFHAIAAVIGAAAMLGGIWLIARRSAERPFGQTALLLFALGSVVLPNVYTRAHDVHFFLGAVLVVPLVALQREHRRAVLAVLAAYLLLQALNSFGIYGFGQTALSSDQPFDAFVHFWDPAVRTVAAAFSVGLFVAMMALARPLVAARQAGASLES